MKQYKYTTLLELIDQMIGISEPRRAEYFRGYRRGIHFHVLGKLEETVQDHIRLCDASDGSSEDPYLDAYARGYRDGCKGLNPGDIPLNLADIPPKSDWIFQA